MSRAAKLSLALLLSLVISTAARAAETIEKFDDGSIKIKYTTNAAGQKAGPYLEYYSKDKIKLRCNYKADLLDGEWSSYFESGKLHIKAVYAAGKLNGPYLENDDKGKLLKDQVFANDLLLYPRSQKLIAATLAEIGVRPSDPPASEGANIKAGVGGGNPNAATTAAAGLTDPVNLAALQRLNAYRFLAGLTWDVKMSADYCDKCLCGARVLAKLGRLEHLPPNPGLPDADYKKGYEATSKGNIGKSQHGTRGSVDGFMIDPGPQNLAQVPHRRWLLNPPMLLTGFGESGPYSVMYSNDVSRKDTPDYDYVAFPVPGYMPVSFFTADATWTVSVNRAKFKPPAADVKVAVFPLLSSGSGLPDPAKRGPALELENFHVAPWGEGIDRQSGVDAAIIFHPKNFSLKGPQTRYWVEVTGLKKSDGADAKIEYLVEFCQL